MTIKTASLNTDNGTEIAINNRLNELMSPAVVIGCISASANCTTVYKTADKIEIGRKIPKNLGSRYPAWRSDLANADRTVSDLFKIIAGNNVPNK